jgi:hypothetical protein
MDPTRFDALARALGGAAPRRAALRVLGAAALTAVGLGGPGAEAAEAPKCSKTRPCPPCKRCTKQGRCKNKRDGVRCAGGTCRDGRCAKGGGSCTAAAEGGQGYAVTQATKASSGGEPLLLKQTVQPFGSEGQSASRIDLTLDGAPLLAIATEGAAGSVTVTLTYGDAFRGINRARFTNDGSTIRGEIDGRAIKPLQADGDPRQVRFEDGTAPPDVRVDPDLAEAIEAILKQAKQEAAACEPTPEAAGGRANPQDSAGCLATYIPCTVGYSSCIYGVAGGCAASLFFYGVCVAIGLGVCFLAAERCRRAIRHNAPCCPVRCGGSPENALFFPDPGCCERGETCLDPDEAVNRCCPSGTRSCHALGCCAEDETCQPNGQCCRPNASLCGEVCCPNGSCQNGECCNSPDKPCGTTCCPSLSTCCAGQCCDGICTNGVCCNEPERYCNGSCCANNCCNGVCCAAGESCDPQTGSCAVVCNTGPLGDQHACPNVPGNPACCRNGRECCPGVGCCSFGLECCSIGGGRNACRDTCIA